MQLVNRSAIVVLPGKLFLDWLHRVDPTSGHLTLADLRREPSIYLLPESDDDATQREDLAHACTKIFEDQLDGWYRDVLVWPTCLDMETFVAWFEFSVHSMLIDTCDAPLTSEDL
jgi:hypothetical protein